MLWTYSREERLLDRDFLLAVCTAINTFTGPKLELDNFDLLLIVQAVMHIERSDLGKDKVFMNHFY